MGSAFLIATGALIKDTFREAMARKIFWGLFGLSTAMILFFLFLLRIDIAEGAAATVTLFGFSALRPGRTVNLETLVRNVHAAVATFLYSFGMFLSVFASSGLVPSLLEPGRIELLLSKPVSRVHLLLGRFLGNFLVVTANIIYLIGGVWLVFGWKAGVWHTSFLWTIVTTDFLFVVLLTIVMLVGVAWESSALATMIPVALMIISPVLAQERIAARLLSSEWSRQVWKTLYYVFPKVYDLGRITLDVVRQQPVTDWMPVWSSALFALVMLVSALVLFVQRDF